MIFQAIFSNIMLSNKISLNYIPQKLCLGHIMLKNFTTSDKFVFILLHFDYFDKLKRKSWWNFWHYQNNLKSN